MNKTLVVLAVLLGGVILAAQSSTPSLGVTSSTGAGAACVVVTGATVTECAATDGLWIAIGTGAFQKVLTGTSTAGVTSFNGRTGVVVSATADYSYSQLSGTPTQKSSISCTTSNLSNTGLTASGCQ